MLQGFVYTIKKYKLSFDSSQTIGEHERTVAMLGLRYLRKDELIDKNTFDRVDFETYTGYKSEYPQLRGRMNLPEQKESWQRYKKNYANPSSPDVFLLL
jgi:hypothetical protein